MRELQNYSKAREIKPGIEPMSSVGSLPLSLQESSHKPWLLDAYLKNVILLTQLFRKTTLTLQFSSVQLLSCLSLWPHGLQHARLPCPSPTPGAYSNSCPLSQWCYSTISSSVLPFSSYLHFSPRIRVFSSESVLCIRWPKYWSFSFSISPSSEYSGLISFRTD